MSTLAGYLVYIREGGKAWPQKVAADMYWVKLGGSEKHEYATIYRREIEKYDLTPDEMALPLDTLVKAYPCKGSAVDVVQVSKT